MEATITLDQDALSMIQSSLAMKRKALEFSLAQYKKQLEAFEKHYDMTSDQFARKFQAGELGDQAHWFEWEFVLDACQETAQQLALVESIHL